MSERQRVERERPYYQGPVRNNDDEVQQKSFLNFLCRDVVNTVLKLRAKQEFYRKVIEDHLIFNLLSYALAIPSALISRSNQASSPARRPPLLIS